MVQRRWASRAAVQYPPTFKQCEFGSRERSTEYVSPSFWMWYTQAQMSATHPRHPAWFHKPNIPITSWIVNDYGLISTSLHSSLLLIDYLSFQGTFLRSHTSERVGYAMVVQAINALAQVAWPSSLKSNVRQAVKIINYCVIQIPNTNKPPHVGAVVRRMFSDDQLPCMPRDL